MRANGKIGSATCPFDVFAILHHDEFAVKLCVHKIDSVSVSIISVSSAILDDFDPINWGAIKCASHFIGRERRVWGNYGVGTRRCCWTNGGKVGNKTWS